MYTLIKLQLWVIKFTNIHHYLHHYRIQYLSSRSRVFMAH